MSTPPPPPFSLDMKYVAANQPVIAERRRLFKSQKYSHFPGWNVQLFVNADHMGTKFRRGVKLKFKVSISEWRSEVI